MKQYCASKFDEINKGADLPALFDCPHWADPRMFEWIMAPEMLDLVRTLRDHGYLATSWPRAMRPSGLKRPTIMASMHSFP